MAFTVPYCDLHQLNTANISIFADKLRLIKRWFIPRSGICYLHVSRENYTGQRSALNR